VWFEACLCVGWISEAKNRGKCHEEISLDSVVSTKGFPKTGEKQEPMCCREEASQLPTCAPSQPQYKPRGTIDLDMEAYKLGPVLFPWD
jgi:hypothetical protein